jgi:class 3 adenylate cyclase
MPQKEFKARRSLVSEFILFGIVNSLIFYILAKAVYLFYEKEIADMLIIFGYVNIPNYYRTDIVGVLLFLIMGFIIAFLFFKIGERSANNELKNLGNESHVFLQKKGLLSLEQRYEPGSNIHENKNTIMKYLVNTCERAIDLGKKNKDMESTIHKLTDVNLTEGTRVTDVRGEIRNLSILYTNIRDFSLILESLTSAETIRFLNAYLNELTKIVHKNQGNVNKYMGDSIMAIFEQKTDARLGHEMRAITAALEIQKLYYTLFETADIRKTTLAKTGLGIGIDTGNAIIGTIGSDERLEFTVIGEPVNFANKMASIAGNGIILIGQQTYDKTNTKIDAIEAQSINITGREVPLKLYIVKSFSLLDR